MFSLAFKLFSFFKADVTKHLNFPYVVVHFKFLFLLSRQNERERLKRKEDLDLCFGASSKK